MLRLFKEYKYKKLNMIKINIPCSKLSSFCGYSKFVNQNEAFFETFKKSNRIKYRNILSKLNRVDRDDQTNRIIEKLPSIEINNVIHTGESHRLSQTIENISNSLVEKLNICDMSQSQKNTIIHDVTKMVDFKIKTGIGIKYESNGLDKFENENNIKITERNDKIFKNIIQTENVTLTIRGCIDGIDKNTNTLIEHKQRMYKLFTLIPQYERFQIMLYMKITGYKKAILIQTYKDKQSSIHINFSDVEWNKIYKKIKHSLELYYTLISDTNRLTQLIKKYSNESVF